MARTLSEAGFGTPESVRGHMTKETWLTSQEARKAGWIHEIIGEPAAAQSITLQDAVERAGWYAFSQPGTKPDVEYQEFMAKLAEFGFKVVPISAAVPA